LADPRWRLRVDCASLASSAALPLKLSADAVMLSIADNGRGFDVADALVNSRVGVAIA
jgi:two-component system NarL family sensor kinase